MSTLLDYSFITYAGLGVVLTGIATGIIGCYIVVRRMVFIAGGVTHSSFAGLGLGFYLGQSPILYAMISAILSGLGVEALSRKGTVREDSAIAAIWSLGMAIGVIFTFLTPGYTPGLSAFLFGNILLISKLDLYLLGLFVGITVPLVIIYYYPILFVSFDSEYGVTQGYPVRLIRTLMMIWICIGIVLSIRVVGIMMLMSMLTLPQMTVNIFTSDFRKMLVYAVLLSIFSGLIALMGSYYLNLPTGAFSIILLSLLFIGAKMIKRLIPRS